MKKQISLILSVILVIGMLALTGCGGKTSIVGKWEGELDMTDTMSEAILAGDETMSEYFNIEEFKIAVTFEIKDDGTYTMSMDKESFITAFEGIEDELISGMTKLYEDLASAMGITVDEMLAASGTTMDQIMEETFTEEMIDEMFDDISLNTEAKYEAKDGKFYSSNDVDSDISDDEYMTYELDGNTLTFTEFVGDDEETDEIMNIICPIVLTKA